MVVLNLEEGAEPAIPDGDAASETALTDANAGEVPAGTRDLVAESLFEYGSRSGFWRVHEAFRDHGIAPTISASARALERNPAVADAIRTAGYDVCAHGWRFERHATMDEATERERIARAVRSLEASVGMRPIGWQSRYSSSVRTRALVVEHGGFLYDADSYADDLPYWVTVGGGPHLVVPHAFTTNDNRYFGGRIANAADFLAHLASAFDVLYAEGGRQPRMMTVSLHARVSGQPARFDAVRRFFAYVRTHEHVWIASRGEVARHWHAHHRPGAR